MTTASSACFRRPSPRRPDGQLGRDSSRELHLRVCQRERISETDYRLSQLRYDLRKLRVKGLVERVGKTRTYRVTASGVRLGMLLVKLSKLLLGPLCTQALAPARPPRGPHPSAVETAIRHVDSALITLCHTLGLQAA